MNSLGVKRNHLYLVCIMILSLLLVFFNNPTAQASEVWEIEEIEKSIFIDAGHKDLLERFNHDKEQIKQDNIALYYYLSGVNQVIENNFQKAYLNFEKSLVHSADGNRSDVEIATLKQLVLLSESYIDSGGLLEYGSRLLELAEANNDYETELYAYKVISEALSFTGNSQKALEYLERMLSLAHEHDIVIYEAVYQTMMGNMSFAYQDIETALSYYEKADQLFESINHSDIEYLKPMNKAMVLFCKSQLSRGDHETILKEIDKLIGEVESRYFSTVMVSNLLNMKGQIEQQHDLNEAAINSYEQSKKQLEKITHMENMNDPLSMILFQLAGLYYENEDYRQAADLYINVAQSDGNSDMLKDFDEVTSKLRDFLERDLNNKIISLTELQEVQEKAIRQQRIMMVIFIIGMIILFRAFILKRKEHKKVSALKNKLYVQSITDSLTGVYNRKQIFEILHSQEQDCVVALIDIDNFKSINDTLGYLVGDEVLRRVVQTINSSIGEKDEIGRYGGEEFLLILRNADLKDAISKLERIRKNVEDINWEYEGLNTTISIGVSTKSDLTAEEVFRKVDALVHKAKRTGKNRVVCKQA